MSTDEPDRLSIEERYHAAFDEMPPLFHWRGTSADLDRLMEDALAGGRSPSMTC
jgi:hypothetical protein